MARIDDLPEPTRSAVLSAPCPSFETRPWVDGPPLSRRRVGVVTSAALFRRGEEPFVLGGTDFRRLPASLPVGDILMSHVSINFDRAGFQRDANVVYPIERLRELAADGVIGGVAETNFSILGSTDPAGMEATADALAGELRRDGVDALVLSPV